MAKRSDPPLQWRSVFYPPTNYPFFDGPPTFASSPTLGKLNIQKAAWMADASALAYGRSGPDLIPATQFVKILETAGFIHCDLLGDWSGGPTGMQAFFAYTKDFAVLSFRGTEKDDWRDLATDLATFPSVEDWSVQGPAAAKTMFQLPSVLSVFDQATPAVHHGFQASLNEVWKDADTKLRNYRAATNNEIFFTGHSLGGALATLAIERFEGGSSSLYTFGSPRVGNRAFIDKLQNKTTLGHFRFVDDHDIVTRVPPTLMFYEHDPSTLYQIDQQGGLHDRTGDLSVEPGDFTEWTRDLKTLSELRFPIELDTRPPDDIYDHSPGRYCNCLWNALPSVLAQASGDS